MCLQRPNSGDALKFLVPSNSRKTISGWSNDPCTVTSQKINENEIGYRGSKSRVLRSTLVKEQRVDGSWFNFLNLRCVLTGFERNYQIKTHSNRINLGAPQGLRRLYSSKVSQQCKHNLIINPTFVSGFVDGEGSFIINISKNNNLKTGWNVQLFFQINLHSKDLAILEKIQSFFGVGNIHTTHGPQSARFRVSSIKDLAVVISHFDKFPLLTQKRADYELFKEAFYLIKNKDHLTKEGLYKIVALRASLNWGLSDELKKAFPEIVAIARPLIQNGKIQDPNWLAGFASAEGCFLVSISNSPTSNLGYKVYLIFKLTQHLKDEELMKTLVEYLGCGKYWKNRLIGEFRITKFSDLVNIAIPFFKEYPILGVKSNDFKDFCKVAELMQNKAHLTTGGLIKFVKSKLV